MLQQTGPQETSPIQGKKKNCSSWAEYEPPGSSTTAALCNGGWYNGNTYSECPVKFECKEATEKPRLPVIQTHAPRPFAGSQVTARTPSVADYYKPEAWGLSLPTTIPTRTVGSAPPSAPQSMPYPVVPPPGWPGAMQTPFAGPLPTIGGQSPTFLPRDDESKLGRLGKNIAQGFVASAGWHVFDYARSVDLFGSRR